MLTPTSLSLLLFLCPFLFSLSDSRVHTIFKKKKKNLPHMFFIKFTA